MQTNRLRAIITGVGAYYPDYILDNEELSQMVDTSDEWIMTRVGIKERRILKDPTKGSAWLGAQAVEDLFRENRNQTGRSRFVDLCHSDTGYAFPC